MGIVVIGNVFVDIKGFPNGKYNPGGRNAGRVMTMHGGVGRNVAADIAGIGLHPAFVSLVDDTDEGEAVIKKLAVRGTNTDYILKTPGGMGMWLAVFDETGDIVASISNRPDSSAMERLIEEKGDEIFADCDGIVLEVDLDSGIVKDVLRFAKKHGKKVFGVVANISIAAKRREFLQEIDCFVCNLEEAGHLFLSRCDALSPEEICAELRKDIESAKIPSMVITLGSKGAVYASLAGEYGVFPARKVNVCDTTGAGDAFCAGIAIGLTYGKTLREAVEIGTRLAASVIMIAENTCPKFLPTELGLDINTEN